jgi:hypothetical protein
MGDDSGSEATTVTRRVELTATVLLAMAALVTAWSAYQSAKWSGVQAASTAAASAARTEADRYEVMVDQEAVAEAQQLLEAMPAGRA